MEPDSPESPYPYTARGDRDLGACSSATCILLYKLCQMEILLLICREVLGVLPASSLVV